MKTGGSILKSTRAGSYKIIEDWIKDNYKHMLFLWKNPDYNYDSKSPYPFLINENILEPKYNPVSNIQGVFNISGIDLPEYIKLGNWGKFSVTLSYDRKTNPESYPSKAHRLTLLCWGYSLRKGFSIDLVSGFTLSNACIDEKSPDIYLNFIDDNTENIKNPVNVRTNENERINKIHLYQCKFDINELYKIHSKSKNKTKIIITGETGLFKDYCKKIAEDGEEPLYNFIKNTFPNIENLYQIYLEDVSFILGMSRITMMNKTAKMEPYQLTRFHMQH